ncbi:uncharacterized protein LOC144349940 [Saccoglossus kowalevskii]
MAHNQQKQQGKGVEDPEDSSESPPQDIDRNSLADFFDKNKLVDLLHYFPVDVTLGLFKATTEDDLLHEYAVDKPDDRERLMRAVTMAREQDEDEDHDDESDYDDHQQQQQAPLSAINPIKPPGSDFVFSLPRNFKLNRQLSEDTRLARRGSLGAAYSAHHLSVSTSHGSGETSNLLLVACTPLYNYYIANSALLTLA